MKTVLLLGGSNIQMSAALRLKEMGCRLILADYTKNPPAAAVADAHVPASTFDVDACVRAAREFGADAVLTTGTDQPVYTAARVAEVLGLPSPISVDTAFKATNKRAMKEAFLRHGVPCVPFAFLKEGEGPDALSALKPPLVIKPLDSQGQRGIFKVETAAEAVLRLPGTLSFSRAREALVERYYPSDELTYSCFIRDGVVVPLTLTDRQLVNDLTHIGVCAAHRYPSVHAAREPEAREIAERVARALGVTAGPLYIQFLVGENGILVNEAACRIGGAFEDFFIPYVTGFEILDAVIRLALGETLAVSVARDGSARVSVQMLFCRPGKIASMTPIEALHSLPGVRTAGYNYRVGDEIPRLENATARFGYCVLATRTGDIGALVQGMYRALRVEDGAGNNLVIPRSYDGGGTADA